MNEKQREVIEQYDVNVKSIFRSRGCLHLATEQGLYMLMPYYGSPHRLAWEYELQKKLSEEEFVHLDYIIMNKENGFIAYDKYRTPFVLKKAYEGKECSLKDREDIKTACKNLAVLHKTLNRLKDYHVEKRDTPCIPKQLEQKAAQLRRIRNFIKKSGRKTEFELTFTSCYDEFYQEASNALASMQKLPKYYWQTGFGICHGAYHQHNVLLTSEYTVTLNLGQFHYNQQVLDLYMLLRKAMEKNRYHKDLFYECLEAYEHERHLMTEEVTALYILFSFPEKFWKISNQYYNGKKCFMPPKNLEKLKKIIESNEARKSFLQGLRNEYSFL